VLLEDFAIVNWAVDPNRLLPHLPAGFEPEERSGTAYVAMVAFRNHGFHFRAAPFARLSCGQADYRTFVRHGGERGVWFFGGSLSSRLVKVATSLWKMPWHYDSIDIATSSAGATGSHWRLAATGNWGAASVALTTTGRAFDEVTPLVGWYPRTDGGVGRYSVWHEPLQLREAVAEVTRCDVFERLGLIDKGQQPTGAGLQRSVPFDVHTPPTNVTTVVA
jgi:uncharacterized protein YqjF (DUF2071 family)